MTIKSNEIVDANNVERVFTLKSMYDNDSVGVEIDGEVYRLKAEEVRELLYLAGSCDWLFKIVQPRKHKYLRLIAWDFDHGGECRFCHRADVTELDDDDVCYDCFVSELK